MLSTYSSSTRYGGAPKEVFKATFTDGTALAPSTRPKTTAALLANRILVFAMVDQAPSIHMWRNETLRNMKVGSQNVGNASNDEAATCCFDQPEVRLHANASSSKQIAVSTYREHVSPRTVNQLSPHYKPDCAMSTLRARAAFTFTCQFGGDCGQRA